MGLVAKVWVGIVAVVRFWEGVVVAGSVEVQRCRVVAGGGSGDWDAVVAEVFEAHRDRLVGFFVRRTGDRELSEDLAHETLVRFAGAGGRFDRDHPVWPYLKAVAGNLLVDVTRGSRGW